MIQFRTMPATSSPPETSLSSQPRHKRLWLLGLLWALSGTAAATTTINHVFSPATIDQGDDVTYRIFVANDAGVALTEAAVTVVLPPEIVIRDPQEIGANTCGFTVSAATPGTSTVYLTAGTIPAQANNVPGLCLFELGVTSVTPGNWPANIPANSVPGPNTAGYQALQGTTLVTNATEANATLSVSALQPPTGNKAFSPSPAIVGDPTRLTITLTNPNPNATIPLTSFTDALPPGMEVASPINPATSCTGDGAVDGALTTDTTSVTLTGGTIGEGGSCTLEVDVVATSVGELTNSVDEGDIGNTRGLTSPAFSTDLTVAALIGVDKAFDVSPIPAGQPVAMTITIDNKSTVNPLDITSFADDLAGTTLSISDTDSSPAAPNPVVACTGSGSDNGSLAYTPDTLNTALTLTNAIAGPGGACTITVYVTSLEDGEHTNSIPPDAVENTVGQTSPAADATLKVNSQLTVSKSVAVDNVAPGQWTTFTVDIFNWSGEDVSNVSFEDVLPSAGGFQMVLEGANPVSSAGCIGGTFGGTDGDDTLTWTGGTIAAGTGLNPGVCTIEFKARIPADAPPGLSFTNEIEAGKVAGNTPDDGITNPEPSDEVDVDSADPVSVIKSFSPEVIPQSGLSTLTITIRNRVVGQISAVDLTDNLPQGLTLAANPAATNTCGGTLQAFPNTDQIILTGGTIAARPDDQVSTDCEITVRVTGFDVGNYQNTIEPDDFDTSVGTIPEPVSAPLDIDTGLSGSKTFSPTEVAPGGTARVKVTLRNAFSGTLTNVSMTDPLGTGLAVANPANASSNCPGSPTLVANPGADTAELLGATLQAGGRCDFFFDVVTSGDGPWTNTIPAGNITSAEGPTSTEAVTADLAVSTVELAVNKSFDPIIVTGGVPSLLRIDLINPSAATMEGVGLTDVFPSGIEVYPVPDASTTCGSGQVSAVPGDNKVVLTGGTIPPNRTCQIFVTITSVAFLNVTNSIADGAVITDQGSTNPLGTVATLSTLQGLGITKSFQPTSIAVGEVARLSMRIVSTLDPNGTPQRELTGVTWTDNLPDGMFVANPADVDTTCAGTGTGGKAVVDTSNGFGRARSRSARRPFRRAPAARWRSTSGSMTSAPSPTRSRRSQIDNDQGVTNFFGTQAALNAANSPTVTKAFANPDRNPGEPNPLTVTITNNDPTLELTGVALTDSLPAGLAIADPANAATTCTDGLVTASPGEASLSLAAATLAANSSCTFSADVVGTDAGDYTNTIAAEALTSDQGLTNPDPTQDTMTVGAPPTIAKAFSPVGIAPDETSTLTITLTNPNAAATTLTEALVDALPGDLLVADPADIGGTCTGGVAATPNGSTVTYASGATIPAGDCTISVDVTSSVEGVFTNIIAAGQLQTSAGNNQAPASASLAVADNNPLVPPTIAKAFAPGTILVDETSTLTLTLGNPNASALTLTAAFVDTLPAGVVIADPANIGGTCTLGSVTAPANSIAYAIGAEIPAGGCTITVAVTSDTGGSYTNTVPAGALVTDGGANLDPATAGLVVQTPTPPTVQKAFSPTTINPGDVSRLTISLGNANDGDITLNADLVDSLPSGVTVANPADLGGTCTIGSVTAAPGTGTITYANGAPIPPGGCTIAVDVTASDSDASPFVNTIPAGALQTVPATTARRPRPGCSSIRRSRRA